MPDSREAGARSDELSRWGDLALALTLPLSTQLATVTGLGRSEVGQARAFEGPVTPAGGAFAIWPLIFASLSIFGVLHSRPRHRPQDPTALALVRASLVGNSLWNVSSQLRGFGWNTVGLIGSSAVAATLAVARYQRGGVDDGHSRMSANLIAPLAGWLTVATFANVETTQRYTRSRSRAWLTPGALVPAAAIATSCGVAVTHGHPVYTAAAAWGLGGIAIKNVSRRPALAAAAVAGLALALAVCVARRRSHGTGGHDRSARVAAGPRPTAQPHQCEQKG